MHAIENDVEFALRWVRVDDNVGMGIMVDEKVSFNITTFGVDPNFQRGGTR